ncbi:MAG: PIG-L family deacetylase [Phycisphaerae bacterium]|nr:PIG-L family deacetylase [Phycisphaerae bacterium]
MARVLVIGPHPDDQELGMGGTIARLAADGHRVTLLDMTDGEPTPFGNRETRAAEAARAAGLLSAPGNPVTRIQLGLRNRVVEHGIHARHAVAGVIRAAGADVLFVPHPEDAHPDHRAVTRIAEDARFDAKLTGATMPGDGGSPPVHAPWLFHYYCTHLRVVPSPSFIVDTTGFEGVKREAILAYRSQFVDNPANRAVPEWVSAADRYFGSRIGRGAGECFFAREPLGLAGLSGLVMPGRV